MMDVLLAVQRGVVRVELPVQADAIHPALDVLIFARYHALTAAVQDAIISARLLAEAVVKAVHMDVVASVQEDASQIVQDSVVPA